MHELHKAIGDIFESQCAKAALKTCKVVKDPACGGEQNIPLFCSPKKSADVEYCDVDLLVQKGNKVKVIIEIEESNVTPIQLFGKLLASALSRCYVHDGAAPVMMDDSILFVQIVDTSKLKKERSSKVTQWINIERSIRRVLPIRSSGICCYRLLYGDAKEFTPDSEKGKTLLTCIQTFLHRDP